jgi:ATP-dependent Clp protease protease subunit
LEKNKEKKEVEKAKSEEEISEPFEDESFDSNQPMLQLLESMNGKPPLRKVYLFGEVNTRSIWSVISQIHLMEADGSEDIELYINSGGGYVIDCFALVDVMNSSSCDFQTIVVGQAASAACLIASNGSCGKRYAGRNSEFLWHEVFGAIPEVRHSEIAFWKRETKRPQEKFNRIFSQNTGRTIKEINDNFYNNRMDACFSAQQAKEFGVVDHLLHHKKRAAIIRKVKKSEEGKE